ncbi:MAG: AAC(3) family N-acetyltransferase [Clostridia bacterium]|nr:AAC(3) family N-acetyltransferase [Clostridia bacterium]
MSVTKNDITKAVKELGIKNGDTILVHSSFKSLGEVDGGAETVICGFLDAIGEEGTLVFPTFVQKDFKNAYKTWHLDKESDVGYLTNYFRLRKGSKRSDQATHSVAASGKMADELTKTHGHTSKRFGSMGDTPFAPDSPWEKMYQKNAKIVMLGVSPLYITFRHYAEYCYIEECLIALSNKKEYDEMKERLTSFGKKGVWPHLHNEVLAELYNEKYGEKKSVCGDAELLCFNAKEFTNLAMEHLRNYDERVLRRNDEAWDTDGWIEWTEDYRKIVK